MGPYTRSPRRGQVAPAWSDATLETLRIWAFAYLANRGIRGTDAEDLAQEALLGALENERFDPARGAPGDAERAWFTGILRNTWLSFRRWKRTRREVPLSRHNGPLAVPSHEGRAEARDLARALEACTTAERWAALVASAAGATARELAEAEGVPRTTIEHRIRSARADLARFTGAREDR